MKVKYLVATAIVIILIGLPIGSYLYLRSGFMYRLEALQTLESKGDFPDSLLCLNSSSDLQSTKLNRKTLLLAQFKDTGHEEELKNNLRLLNDQFSDSKTFQMVWLLDSSVNKSLNQDLDILNCNVDKLQLDELFLDNELMLVDTSLQIRNRYSYSAERFKKVVEHLAIILPREKRKNIVLQRESEK